MTISFYLRNRHPRRKNLRNWLERRARRLALLHGLPLREARRQVGEAHPTWTWDEWEEKRS